MKLNKLAVLVYYYKASYTIFNEDTLKSLFEFLITKKNIINLGKIVKIIYIFKFTNTTKKICRKLLSIFLQNILYKTLFATNFVKNTCEFYNFIGNNYPRRNYLSIKILRKNSRKKLFLVIFLTNL